MPKHFRPVVRKVLDQSPEILKVFEFFHNVIFTPNCSSVHVEWNSHNPVVNFLTRNLKEKYKFQIFQKLFYTNSFFSTRRVQFQQTSTIFSLEFSKGPVHVPKNSKNTNFFRKRLRNCFSGGDEWSFVDNADFYCSISKKTIFFSVNGFHWKLKSTPDHPVENFARNLYIFTQFPNFYPQKSKKSNSVTFSFIAASKCLVQKIESSFGSTQQFWSHRSKKVQGFTINSKMFLEQIFVLETCFVLLFSSRLFLANGPGKIWEDRFIFYVLLFVAANRNFVGTRKIVVQFGKSQKTMFFLHKESFTKKLFAGQIEGSFDKSGKNFSSSSPKILGWSSGKVIKF